MMSADFITEENSKGLGCKNLINELKDSPRYRPALWSQVTIVCGSDTSMQPFDPRKHENVDYNIFKLVIR